MLQIRQSMMLAAWVMALTTGSFDTPAGIWRNASTNGRTSTTTADCALGTVPVRGSDIHGAATVMLRPEQLSASAVPDCDDAAGAGTVIASEFLGSDVIVTIDLPCDGPPINVRQASIDAPSVHAKVRIEVTGAAVVFEAQP